MAASAEVPAFADEKHPPAPDYARSSSWISERVSAVVPTGATPRTRNPAVDVFFVHPTTFQSRTEWNQDIGDRKTNAWTDVSTIARQASVFNGCCRVYAPRYRQASLRNDKSGGRDRALDFAYGDIERAFDYFIAHRSRGRPFIIAGHSQGGYMVARLLDERIDGTPLQSRMVAAYAIGFNLAEGDFGRRFKHIPICERPAQTGCAVQWNAVLPTTDLKTVSGYAEQGFIDKYGDVVGKRTLCINPLTFDRAIPAAGTAQSRGAVPGDPGKGTPQPLKANAVSARCDRGMLVVDPDPALGLKPLPGGSMHYHDFGLFYQDIRDNAVLRATTFLAGRRPVK